MTFFYIGFNLFHFSAEMRTGISKVDNFLFKIGKLKRLPPTFEATTLL